MAVISGNKADGKPMQIGGWYNGQQWDGSSLGAAGVENIGANKGRAVSNEVIGQTNPNNVSYIQSQVKANQLQAPVSIPLSSGAQNDGNGLATEVQNARRALEATLGTRKAETDQKLQALRDKEQATLGKIGELSTPFRQEIETAERERLYVNKNFEENQALVDELDSLLTEGNNLIKQQQSVTGLAAVRNPRIQKTMDDVQARAGVIQAVMSARNGQIAQATNLIDRTVGAIAADRQDQINYYQTILNLNNRDIISLDGESKKLAEEQLNLKKVDLEQAQASANYVKQLMLNPTTAALMGQAGVKLNDSVETINAKLQVADNARETRDISNQMALKGNQPIFDPSKVPANQLITITAPDGTKMYFRDGSKAAAAAPSSSLAFIAEQLGIKDAASITPTKGNAGMNTIIANAVRPSFTPKNGIGSIFTDTLGGQWQYQSQGWVPLPNVAQR